VTDPAEVLGRLRALADPSRLPAMARSGIGGGTTLGVRVGELRALAKDLGRSHELAAELADDDRPLVRKGASWALRQIGKRSPGLHARAIETARELRSGGRGARWVGADALRELERGALR
jgi:3-methyladenine DNA glycosylase AlkD